MIVSDRLKSINYRIHELIIHHDKRRDDNKNLMAWDYEPRLVELIAYRESLVKQLINEKKYKSSAAYQKTLEGGV